MGVLKAKILGLCLRIVGSAACLWMLYGFHKGAFVEPNDFIRYTEYMILNVGLLGNMLYAMFEGYLLLMNNYLSKVEWM